MFGLDFLDSLDPVFWSCLFAFFWANCPCCGTPCTACTGSTPDTIDVLLNGTASNSFCSDCGDFSNATFTLIRGNGSVGGPDEYPCHWALEDQSCGLDLLLFWDGTFLNFELTGLGQTSWSKNVGGSFDCTAEHELINPVDPNAFECDFTGITSITVNPP